MTEPRVDLYWRPGCGFCSSLIRGLEALGIDTERHNIWEDADAAAVVRRAANGSETVPTVVVGEHALVNPTARQVAALVESERR